MADRRIENDVFFAGFSQHHGPRSIPDDVFFGSARPPQGMTLAERASLTPWRFAAVAFLVGWAGILFQASLLQQIVFGAPVFEELAKFGPALMTVLLLRLRTPWLRVPVALLWGAGFGVFEHYVTYPDEAALSYANRVAFHAGSTGLSMAFWGAFEDAPDVRARWATTVPATILHWVNNFGAVVFGVGSLLFAAFGIVAEAVSLAVVGVLYALLIAAFARPRAFRASSREALASAVPALQQAPAPAMAGPSAPAAAPLDPHPAAAPPPAPPAESAGEEDDRSGLPEERGL